MTGHADRHTVIVDIKMGRVLEVALVGESDDGVDAPVARSLYVAKLSLAESEMKELTVRSGQRSRNSARATTAETLSWRVSFRVSFRYLTQRLPHILLIFIVSSPFSKHMRKPPSFSIVHFLCPYIF